LASERSRAASRAIWSDAGLDESALSRLTLTGSEPGLPSSFAVSTAAQASLGVAALVASEIGRVRNGRLQTVDVDLVEAAVECTGRFTLDGAAPEAWDKLAGLYSCGSPADGEWVRLHTNFAHHRDGVLRLLGLPAGPATTREQVATALASWRAADVEDQAAELGLVVARLRRFDEWDRHPQSDAVATLPLVEIERIGEAAPLEWPRLDLAAPPLAGLRVLDLTRILAGPVGGRTLAAYGADVMLVNSPNLPNIESIADTSRGKRSALADLHDGADRAAFTAVLRDAHVMLQGYRPGGLDALGFGAADAAALRPGIVYVSLSAYGRLGPWSMRRGFDSLVQTATGFNDAEGMAFGGGSPRALPMQILDMASAFLIAFGTQAALLRQRAQGGSWHVQVSLARTAAWLRSLGRVDAGFAAPPVDARALMEPSESGFGPLQAVRHAARFSATPARYARASVPPGTDPLAWT
jgi:crotonobetainyl-CoA:carnitine CoA-transferase CaiB-like acyl-CoA transferase